MSNYKSFVFNRTSESTPLVTPTGGRYHLYINAEGQIEVINHLGEIIAQSPVDFNLREIVNFFTISNGEIFAYRESGTVNGRPRYVKVDGDQVTQICFWADNNPGEWVIYDPSLVYRSTDDVANPTLVTNWTSFGTYSMSKTSPLYTGTLQQVTEKLAESVGVQPLIYHALISQSSSNEPEVFVMENTLGDILWFRNDVGDFSGLLLSGGLTENKTSIIHGTSTVGGSR